MTHTLRVAKTTLTIVLGTVFIVLVGGLFYLNQVGFPGRYGEWFQEELSNRGVHLSFDTLRFDLKNGLIAKDVSFFEDEARQRPLLEAGEMTLDLDKTKAMRGVFKLISLQVSQGTASVPVDKNGRFVTAREINGTLAITESGRAVIEQASGLIEGIRVNLSADLRLSNLDPEDLRKDQQEALQSNHVLSLVLDELALWNIRPDTPPELTFQIQGDLADPERLQTSFQLKAQNLDRNDYHLDQLSVAGDLQSQLVTLDEILLQDPSGTASGKADWSVSRRSGRFDITSSLQLQDFLQSCFGITVLKNLNLQTSPVLDLKGTFAAPMNEAFSVRATGHGDIGVFTFLDRRYESLSSDFAWHDGDLYLRELAVVHQDGNLNGTLLLQDDLARYDVRSTLPLAAYRPFIKPDSGLDRITQNATFAENSILALDVVGSLDRNDLTEWSAAGKAHLSNILYQDTCFHHLACDFNFIPGQVEFSDLRASLNDDREKARTRFNGPPSEELYADRILHDGQTKITTVSNLRGQVWPTPIVRIFTPSIAEYLEKEYRFHQPPQITLNGRFAGRSEDLDQNFFSIAAITGGRTDYPFLGADLPLENLRADIIVQGAGVDVKNLTCSTLGGEIGGTVFSDVSPGKLTKYRGSMKWNALSFPLISQAYEFDEEEKGTLTGSIEFNGTAGGVRGFNSDGVVAINKGNLVSLPILGPLSPIIAGVLGDKRMGYERAKDASATFAVRNGVLQTKDFVATSTSIVLTGEGWVDLLTDKMDMTVRINARGLLGFLTLPLQPLKGIFQFRGTGDYSEPQWRSSPFTRPAKGLNNLLFQQPSKAIIVPE